MERTCLVSISDGAWIPSHSHASDYSGPPLPKHIFVSALAAVFMLEHVRSIAGVGVQALAAAHGKQRLHIQEQPKVQLQPWRPSWWPPHLTADPAAPTAGAAPAEE